MNPILLSLFEHQFWADASLLKTVAAQPGAWQDAELRGMLHHILMVQYFFPVLILGLPFDSQRQMGESESLDELAQHFGKAQELQKQMLSTLGPESLLRVLEIPQLPFKPTVEQALIQIVTHSQGHRGQCLTRLRILGAKPPALDYILWAMEKPGPDWPLR